ncbi:glycoside hydrolase family 88 protein [Carboxylicivirga sp. M1479]|uniref:glycoside hydrolase family 88 protein n=1 Tax=Carboxylicivirga sp. M1479 TaxID=2594476 RepID=UPI001178565B|nr:glycoside hydrolase family 88 protein [Carboxylicivirga sp. M1479]TRX71887.1 glucuronyl hydrolase [Carboxylicivirga sp. M1479]
MKTSFIKNLGVIISIASLCSCNINNSTDRTIDDNLDFACEQTSLLLNDAEKAQKIPRTITADGHMHWTREGFDWTEGFFPGTCWYLFEYSNNAKWKKAADHFQEKYESHRLLPFYHDLGFVFNCSYGHAYRLTGEEAYKQVLIDAGNTLITRFNPQVGCIRSWDVDKGWQSKRGWQYPVIIDNMMNLEMLFELSNITGERKYADVAISHANVTMKNHFREDISSYHVIDYDSITGEVRNKHTAQGFAHESEWARGQAWGLYGYTICYRYTKDPKYLQLAEKIADYIMQHPALPADHIPYWDYDAPKVPNEPRDASAAAITASALIELNTYSQKDYMTEATTIINSLSSDNYLAKKGKNHHFILKHSVGSIPHNNEIDVPLNYADYYYVEALMRLRKNDDLFSQHLAESK